MALPEVEEGTTWGNRCWKVRGKAFVWVRPLGKKDRADLGEAAPDGEIAGVRVADAADKLAVLEQYDAVFTIPHLDNFGAVLIELDRIEPGDLTDLIVDAWLCMASAKLARAYADGHGLG